VRFVVHKVALERDFLRVFRYIPVGIIARVLHTRAAFTRWTSGRNFTKSSAVRDHCIEQCYRGLTAG
jgi:hypothetical protein